jgi:hypothetical protein
MTICTEKCRDCEGVSHHWIAESDHRDDPAEMTYLCLHCPARGVSCPECEGLGTLEDCFEPDEEAEDAGLLGYSLEEECPGCDGWGIVELPTPKPKPTRKPKPKPRGEAR